MQHSAGSTTSASALKVLYDDIEYTVVNYDDDRASGAVSVDPEAPADFGRFTCTLYSGFRALEYAPSVLLLSPQRLFSSLSPTGSDDLDDTLVPAASVRGFRGHVEAEFRYLGEQMPAAASVSVPTRKLHMDCLRALVDFACLDRMLLVKESKAWGSLVRFTANSGMDRNARREYMETGVIWERFHEKFTKFHEDEEHTPQALENADPSHQLLQFCTLHARTGDVHLAAARFSSMALLLRTQLQRRATANRDRKPLKELLEKWVTMLRFPC
jgi:hypothetical protein